MYISKNINTELFAIRACMPNFGGPHSANQTFNFAPLGLRPLPDCIFETDGL